MVPCSKDKFLALTGCYYLLVCTDFSSNIGVVLSNVQFFRLICACCVCYVCYVAVCYVVDVVLCSALFCSAVPCYVVLCHVMRCYVSMCLCFYFFIIPATDRSICTYKHACFDAILRHMPVGRTGVVTTCVSEHGEVDHSAVCQNNSSCFSPKLTSCLSQRCMCYSAFQTETPCIVAFLLIKLENLARLKGLRPPYLGAER